MVRGASEFVHGEPVQEGRLRFSGGLCDSGGCLVHHPGEAGGEGEDGDDYPDAVVGGA